MVVVMMVVIYEIKVRFVCLTQVTLDICDRAEDLDGNRRAGVRGQRRSGWV